MPPAAGQLRKGIPSWGTAGRGALFAVSLLLFVFIGLSVAAELVRPFDDDFCLSTARPLAESTHVETSYSVVPPRVACRYEYANGAVETMSAPAYGRAAGFASLGLVPLAGMVLSMRRNRR